jgi:lipoprotein-anchoring transpeptidase ErfK/SrfK
MLARVATVVGATAVVLSFAIPPASADGGSITGYSPSAAPAGTTVAVTGSGFAGATGASFNGTAAASFTVVSDTEVDAVVPASATSGPVSVALSDASTVQGPPFTVVPTATLTSSATTVVYPATAELTATLTSGGAGVPNQTGTLESEVAGASGWTSGPQAVTDANGVVHFTVKPVFTTAYRVEFAATTAYGEAGTDSLTIRQRPQVFLRLPAAAPILTAVRVKGFVWPRQVGRVWLEQYRNGGWHWVQSRTSDATGHFVFTVRLPAKSTYTYRARRLSDVRQRGNVGAAAKVLGVDRTLRLGLSGPDVRTLQRRLRALHYDVGRVSGTYTFDTEHAVTAFEKVQRMTRDGVVGPAVLNRLASPRVPRLRHPLRGAAVEIDLTRQVLYYAVDGRIVRILDTSTGGGYYYTGSDGTTQRALTPTGHFSIRYKIDRWVTSKLGVLYRPAYFNNSGYAIHGEPLVPSYPASHGCVRITVPAMNRMYDKLTYGMSVWIYR